MAKSFDELVAKTTTPQVRARAAKRTRELLAEMLLREIRKMVGKSQTELARILKVKQPGVSKLEQQDDMQISTLKRIVEALGGEVHIITRASQKQPWKLINLNKSDTNDLLVR